MNIYDHIQ